MKIPFICRFCVVTEVSLIKIKTITTQNGFEYVH